MIQKNLGLLLLIFHMLSSCSSLRFVSDNTIPVYYQDRTDHQKLETISGIKESYFWGLYAPDQVIYLDQEFESLGAKSVADLSVHVQLSMSDWFKSIISLGLYTPRHYKVVGRIKR